MNRLTLREACAQDASSLGVLHVASWQETYTGLLPGTLLARLSADDRAAMWHRILGAPNEHGSCGVYVIEHQGRMIGFGSCGRQRDEGLSAQGFSGEFHAIYVLRSHQRQGAGKAIMGALAARLLAAGHSAASLWVLRANEPAHRFYARIGGTVIGERIDEGDNAKLIEDAFGWRDLAQLGC